MPLFDSVIKSIYVRGNTRIDHTDVQSTMSELLSNCLDRCCYRLLVPDIRLIGLYDATGLFLDDSSSLVCIFTTGVD